MRQVLSTAITAVTVSLLTLTVAGALAQSEPSAERTVTPAGLNADRVDGKHAVSYTNKKLVRRNKLVATNRQGLLPSNIVKPFWGFIRNKPAGFADGVDNEGVTGVTITRVSGSRGTVNPGSTGLSVATCPAGAMVVAGGFIPSDVDLNIFNSTPAPTGQGWQVYAKNTEGSTAYIYAYAMCLTPEPSAAISTAGRGSLPSSRRGVVTD